MIKSIFVFCFLVNSGLGFTIGEERAGCVLNLNRDLAFEQPLILKPGTKEFLNPGSNGLQVATGGKILLACTGKDNFISIKSKAKELEAECVNGNNFKTKDGSEIITTQFKNLKCNDYPASVARKTGRKCSGKYTEIEIGFDISSGFVKLLNTCMDESKRDSLYAIYAIPASIRQQQIRIPRPDGFEEGDFYPGLYPTPGALYSKRNQLNNFAKLLKSEELAKKYVQLDDDYFYIARGHLAAKADFIYASQQRATFYYVNVAPQWQVFNSANWEQLEIDVRDLASNRGLDLTVITGVWGGSSLPDVNNRQTLLSLYLGRNTPNQLTVPETYWKVLYEPVSKTGIALVAHNNPYEKDVAQRPICKNLCNRVNWLQWQPTNVTAGYAYCCDVNDFRKTVTYLPELDVRGLLT